MGWRFRTSKQGLKVVRSACKQLGWTRDTIANDQSLIEASKILEPDKIWPQEGFHGRLYADGINEASWRRFLIGKDTLSAHIFVAYCLALNVTWEAVVDWSEVDSPIPFKIPHTLPGNRVAIAVNLKAPDVATTTTAIWKMTDSDGKLCYPDRYR
ncbi:MAG: hypothetical protein AAGF01_32645, partial [Cyanobacteria bacterium P01_G01_bin.38]